MVVLVQNLSENIRDFRELSQDLGSDLVLIGKMAVHAYRAFWVVVWRSLVVWTRLVVGAANVYRFWR